MRDCDTDRQDDAGPDGKRHGDAAVDRKRFFRTGDRYFQVDGQWYFAAREGDEGPYRNRETAVVAVQRFLRAKMEAAGSGNRGHRRAPEIRRAAEPLYRHALALEQRVHERLFLPLDD